MKKYLTIRSKLADRLVHFLFVLPFTIGACIYILYPIVMSVIYSFSHIMVETTGYSLDFVGLTNYKFIFFTDPTFVRTLYDTIRSTFLNVPVVIIFSFFIASLLTTQFRGRSVARAILFLPLIVSSGLVTKLLASDVTADMLTNKSATIAQSTVDFSGAFATYLNQFQISSTITSLLVSSVNGIGNILALSAIPIIIFVAGLNSISPSIHEAAYVEGATGWETFWKISLPMISPMILVVIVYCIIDSFTSVTNAVMQRVRTVTFSDFNFGVGSAMTWVYLLLVVILLLVVYLIVNRFVFYYD